MQRPTPIAATHGVSSLFTGGTLPSWHEAYHSPALLDIATPIDSPRPVRKDPLQAARAWLAHPGRDLPPALVRTTEACIEMAQQHFHDLDRLASEATIEGLETGRINEGRIAQIDQLASSLLSFSIALRELLELDRVDAAGAERRMRLGMTAAHQGGGLHSLISALQAP